jgi:DNA-directed RNA polymerase specialized sigma24 family protein
MLQDASNKEDSNERNAAINYLCNHYWYPLYAFARWKGLKHPDAQDQTQAFLAHLIAQKSFDRADPARGRFRSFLLTAFQNYLIKQWEHDHAKRRGGGVEMIALEMAGAEERFSQDEGSGTDFAANFDRVWALAVMEACLEEMAAIYHEIGTQDEFTALRGFLNPLAVSDTNLAAAAEQLGINELAMRQRISRARMKFAKIVRNHVAGLLDDPTPEAVEQEMRHLRNSLERI